MLRVMERGRWFEFELLDAAGGELACVRLGNFTDRWVAVVQCGSSRTDGLGPTARAALVAALAPFGERKTTVFMAAPEMFAASAMVLAGDRAG